MSLFQSWKARHRSTNTKQRELKSMSRADLADIGARPSDLGRLMRECAE